MIADDAAATFDTHFLVALDAAEGLATLTLAVAFAARHPPSLRMKHNGPK